MKKIAMILVVGLVSTMLAIAQESTVQNDAEKKLLDNIVLAYNLADYGYENDSASALLQAAEIMLQIQKDMVSAELRNEETSNESIENEKPDYSVEQLLNDAKKLAGKDKNLLAWAKDVEKVSKTSTRGSNYGSTVNRYVYRCMFCRLTSSSDFTGRSGCSSPSGKHVCGVSTR